VAGAAGLKLFDTHVAGVGLTRAQASALGLKPRSAWLCGYDRAHYYPEARDIALQLVYEGETERVLGVQAAGSGEVHKRIDTAAQLLTRQARLSDLAHIEHAYAPPYAPAVDPLATLAMVAQNQQRGLQALSPLTALEGLPVLDVRHARESEARPVAGGRAELLPQSELRAEAERLKSQEWLVVCERGTRSAEVAQWLQSRGDKARYLGGGLRWRALAGL
jgi:rhodanese-related sulfurtransferase